MDHLMRKMSSFKNFHKLVAIKSNRRAIDFFSENLCHLFTKLFVYLFFILKSVKSNNLVGKKMHISYETI